ncbi:MAG: SAM-dependent methyltransferase [Flammeovirgaceae bacterium]|nr:SAM-dependent methyltransferase [Flammeovirgaceae bacterium]MBE62694.1 SAM-dependent methyltransferase [Flammeovirgaceae bacterium]|tara:strand:+ start:2863 stop:3465 length:603 start_codon:yes stop_codon:yes gene_type:complete
MWDERYSDTDFAYGKTPNEFFKKWINEFEPGRILMPADGEGRNGVYAATEGWHVTSFDLSHEGKKKAEILAKENNVSLHYMVGDFEGLQFEENSFDALGMIYAHFPASKKSVFHQRLATYLKPGGIVILEGYAKSNLPLVQENPAIGGPKDLDMLYSKEEIEDDFKDFEIIYSNEELVQLTEGKYHNGEGSLIRFIGRKK